MTRKRVGNIEDCFPGFAKKENSDKETHGIIYVGGEARKFKKGLIRVGKMGDLRSCLKSDPNATLEVASLFGGETVRKIKFKGKSVLIDTLDGSGDLKFSSDTEIYYEPWTMDRGSLVFESPEGLEVSGRKIKKGTILKLATEEDPVYVSK